MHRFGHQGNKIPERIVGRRRLRNFVVRFGFDGVNEVGKFHRVLNKKDRNIVSDQIIIAFVGVKFDGETAHVARQIGRAARTGNG